jgi:hypothetical protein
MSSRDDDPYSDPFSEASLRAHPADRNYSTEARRAASAFLSARRGTIWSAAVMAVLLIVLVVEISFQPNSFTYPIAITLGLLFAAVGQATAYPARMWRTRPWMESLRRMKGWGPIPSSVRTTTYARAVLSGDRAASPLETALVTLVNADDHTETELAEARRVLAHHGVPDISSEDFQLRPDTHFPWWNRDGIDPHHAPLPDLDHKCQPWAVAVTDPGTEKATVVFRCACGGVNYENEGWTDRNSRRRDAEITAPTE